VVTEHVKGTNLSHLSLLVPFDPTRGVDEESLLIQLSFVLANPTSKLDYGYRTNTELKLGELGTFFEKANDEDSVWPDAAFDGNVTIYACDALEVGSAQISPSGQTFSIPLYVTHVQSETMPSPWASTTTRFTST